MFIRRLLLVAAAALTTAGLVVGQAGAAAPEVRTPHQGDTALECGVNPTTDVHLVADLTCDHSFTVGTASSTTHVTVNLEGHTLTVTDPDAPCRFGGPVVHCAVFGAGPVRLVNGRVRGSVGLASSRAANRVDRAFVDGDLWLSGVGGSITRTWVEEGSIMASSQTVTFRDGLVFHGGIHLDDTSSAVVADIESDVITGSPGIGIAVVLGGGGEFANDMTGTIAHDTIVSPAGDGIDFAGALTNLGQFSITSNWIVSAGGDGVHLAGTDNPPTPYVGGPVTLARNRVGLSAGQAVDAPWVSNVVGTGIVDGGGNVAFHDQPGCVGVTCRTPVRSRF